MIRIHFPLIVALGGALAYSSCSSSKDDDDSKSTFNTSASPCDNELAGQCGEDCSEDEDCPDNLYCDDGECRSDCTETGEQCEGTCSDRGECDGTLRKVAITPVQGDDDGFLIDDSDDDGTDGPIEACGSGTLSADLKPVNMFLMFDRSLSMADDNKWDRSTEALSAFIADPAAADLGIALRFFGDPTCNDSDCSMDACSDPLVPLGTLQAASGGNDPQEDALLNAIDDADPDFLGTPIHAALGGALQWAVAYQRANIDQTTVVVLVTDGEPRGCNEDINAIASLASDAFDEAGVRTYAVGLEGSNPQQMNAIAEAGQTNQGYLIGSGTDATDDLIGALNDIRGRSLACEFPVPAPTGGATLNPNEVNVLFSSDGQSRQSFDPVASAGDCGDTLGWFYDDPADPETIYLCEAACELALSSSTAELEVLLGCPSGEVPDSIVK